MNNLFEQASKRKLRFDSSIGQLSTEQLWELPLPQLNELAISLNRKVKDVSTESFIQTETKVPKDLSLRFEIVKAIIAVKLEEADKAKKTAERKVQRDKLLNALANKQDEKINTMSIKALEKELDALDDEVEEE
jgi:hypothetical protein